MSKGTVKFFNTSKGFGFITQDEGDDLFFHVSENLLLLRIPDSLVLAMLFASLEANSLAFRLMAMALSHPRSRAIVSWSSRHRAISFQQRLR